MGKFGFCSSQLMVIIFLCNNIDIVAAGTPSRLNGCGMFSLAALKLDRDVVFCQLFGLFVLNGLESFRSLRLRHWLVRVHELWTRFISCMRILLGQNLQNFCVSALCSRMRGHQQAG